MDSKIVERDRLIARIRAAKRDGQRVVHCHGCFDMIHPGHIRYLDFARRQGDLLVVSMTGDSQIDKGDQRPFIPEELRAESLAALAVVDLVYVNPAPTAVDLLRDMQPDIYVKGREYEHSDDPGFIAERDAVASYGGRVLFSSGDVVFSSTRLIEAMTADPSFDQERLTLICRRHEIDRERLETITSRFAGMNVLVVGDVILDRYVLCDATDLASEAPMMSLTQQEERVHVGGAAIVARHAAAMGANACLLSAGGTDTTTTSAQSLLEAERVNTRFIPCRSDLPQKCRFLVETNKLLRVEKGQSQPLDSIAEANAAQWVSGLNTRFDAVILCDFGYGTITLGLLEQLRRLWGEDRPIIAADVSGPRAQLLQFMNADLLCPTERELRTALHDYGRGLASVAWDAMEKTQARRMITTLGKRGVVTFDRQTQNKDQPEWRGRLRSEYLPSLADQTVDPLGCGDALLATATLALTAGANLMQASYLGTAAAAIEIGRMGNVPVDAGALRRWLSGRIELAPTVQAQPRRPMRFKVRSTESPGTHRLGGTPIEPTAARET